MFSWYPVPKPISTQAGKGGEGLPGPITPFVKNKPYTWSVFYSLCA